ncbi:MAG: S-methyl-5'-thioadenosine phosphorylase [Verrucomicrobiota bacterium]|nr:S-methyl-5'-thioadenosine phosphorylase [Verrucomicrobiota bacterium]
MKLGILGGSGLCQMEELEQIRRRTVKTPFGRPSDAFVCGRVGGHDVVFLPRHGQGHRLLPSEINHRANIHGFKQLGVERVLSVSAVGSLQESRRPRDVVLADQYFDRAKRSLDHTFFGGGMVAHIAFAEPTCAEFRGLVAAAARAVVKRRRGRSGVRVFEDGTYVNMEGPAFSTRAESRAYRKLGFDVVGMTSLAEAKLCREAELCYQTMAMITDYDCWRETDSPVSVEMIMGHLLSNTELAKAVIMELIPMSAALRRCGCGSALKNAILTDRKAIPPRTAWKLRWIVGKYLGG